jgi:hypothetical protein
MRFQVNEYSKFFGVVAMAAWCGHGMAQTFVYVEANNPSCPVPVPVAVLQAAPKTVKSSVSVPGAIRVACSFREGSYTVTLSSTDPSATFSPKTFLVNFGTLSGSGAFSIKFATLGEQTIFATITSNMGSPPLFGKFISSNNIVNVVGP